MPQARIRFTFSPATARGLTSSSPRRPASGAPRYPGVSYLYHFVWSPDSTKILWADKKMRLMYVDVDTQGIDQVAQGKRWEIHNYVWSPDSKWIAYARPDEEMLQKVWLHSLEQNKAFEVTDGWYDSSQPEFSADGKYLYFVSERHFKPIYSETEWNHAYADMDGIYFVTLAKDTKSPFAPKSDDEPAAEPTKKGERQVRRRQGKGAKKKTPAAGQDRRRRPEGSRLCNCRFPGPATAV